MTFDDYIEYLEQKFYNEEFNKMDDRFELKIERKMYDYVYNKYIKKLKLKFYNRVKDKSILKK
jgi:hypothetical protein